MTSWSGRRVVLGVTGGIACYKSCMLARQLVEAGARVDVVLTRAAAEFVRPVTFEALTGRPVLTSLWEPGGALSHIRLGEDADVVIVAPATAHLIARLAQGIADDLLTTLLLATTAPVLLAPAMNDEMFAAATTRANLAGLAARGVATVGPEIGALAEGPSDRPGRMSEPNAIMRHAERVLASAGSRLAGRRVVVTGGPTREPLDPVRVMTNRSSGRMGIALAEAAWARGANVRLILGPGALVPHAGIEVERVETTADMGAAVGHVLPATDVLVMAAAPADYRADESASVKRPRSSGMLNLALAPTDDILVGTRSQRKPGAVIVGFALETGDALERGRAKLAAKALDLIVVNDALEPGAGFEVETNRVVILGSDGSTQPLALASKREIADGILDAVEARLG